jgi:hypothetical protein
MFSATGELEDWGLSDPMWFELKAALRACEFGETIEFGDDEEELLGTWSEEEEPGWCGRSCCQEIVMAARKVTKAAPGAGLPAARLTEQRRKQLPQREQTFMEMLLEEQLRSELLQGEARGKAAPAAGPPAARVTEQRKMGSVRCSCPRESSAW